MNPLEKAVQSGLQMNERVSDLIARVGTSEHTRGYVHVAYRNALRAMETALQEPGKLQAVNEVLEQLRATILSETQAIVADAQVLGVEEAVRQLGFYGINVSPDFETVLVELSEQGDSAIDAVIARMDAQIAAVRGLVITGAETEQITGSDDRKGVLKSSDVASAVVFWATASLWDSFSWWTTGHSGRSRFKKQAVAWIDERTTQCCRNVNGQIRRLNEPFHLTGTPRYADRIDWPAFHDYCRTAGVLYQADFDLGITERLIAGSLIK